MGDELTRGVDRRREAGPQDERVETRLEDAEQVLTGDALHRRRLLEVVAQLTLADVVLVAQLLLLEELATVVAHATAATQAVLAGRIVALFEVSLRLVGQRDPQLARGFDFGSVEFHCGVSEAPLPARTVAAVPCRRILSAIRVRRSQRRGFGAKMTASRSASAGRVAEGSEVGDGSRRGVRHGVENAVAGPPLEEWRPEHEV